MAVGHARAAGPAAAVGAAPPPAGASALDAWAAWRTAEDLTYRLPEDGVRTLVADVESSLVDLLAAPGGPLSGAGTRITLYWRDGECRVVITGGEALDPAARGRLAALIEPLHEMILPYRPSRSLMGYSFRFLAADDPWLRMGERGIEAVARTEGGDPERAVIAIGAGGLVVRELIERGGGAASEFEYEHVLRDGRHLLGVARGIFRGVEVSLTFEWGAKLGHRPLPTRLQVDQSDGEGAAGKQVFRFSRHHVNGPIPEDVLPSPSRALEPSLDPGDAGR